MIDTGLLFAMADLDAETIIKGNSIFEEFKGALTEQYVLQELKLNNEIPIFYWSPETGTSEVDFVIQVKNNIIPIEVKASVNLKAKSLALYRQKYNPKYSIRTSLAGYEINADLHNIPLYMAENMLKLLEK